MKMHCSPLSALVEHSRHLPSLRKADVSVGDRIYLKTTNSVYSLRVLEGNTCLVTGGWFDRKGLSPHQTHVRGCTWGGSSIKIDIIAACGLCVEFGNRVVTSTIQKIVVLPRTIEN
jgi:hypothetical protein